MNTPAPTRDEPAEHARFAAHLRDLARATGPEETAVVARVLGDPDRTMARSAVLRHLDRRATDLHPGPEFEAWADAMTGVVGGDPFLTRRLLEWSLIRVVVLERPWRPGDLLESSDWLQLKAAATSNAEVVQLLAERGRTKRIRRTARLNRAWPGDR
ncbi:hypothetical protein SAM40697_0428 [Streptomyces ambofaciens]|uniref:HEAT repeat domain-containing protein n=1 Tax=Streptomyces ambofaciens TaxID=1889 RepID=A0ABN4NZN1_STRAM|nr:hypothetical protein [Streptomyces ambofaciens]ANB04390.1 hypothetical protein SAM40697_0428 [Streptomyces ambofaciens]